jgi:GAF domain-containing protein
MRGDNKVIEEKTATSPSFMLDADSLIQLTADIGSRLANIFDLDELVETVTSFLQQNLGYDQVALQLLDSDRQKFTLKIQSDHSQEHVIQSCLPDNYASLAHRAVRRKTVICISDLVVDEPSYYSPNSGNIRAELHIPLQHNQDVLGVLSFGSCQPSVFDNPEISTVIRTLAAQLALAIERAYQHELTSGAADPKIYSQVADMHHLSPGLQTQAGVNDLFDKVVRAVVEGMGCTAAMLAILDQETQMLPVQAIAYNDLHHHQDWEFAKEILGVQIIGAAVSLDRDRANVGVQACLTGSVKITHSLDDLFKPVVDRELCQRVQSGARIKTFAVIPLKVEQKVVGILCTGTERNEISKADIDGLRFYASNAAIALQNSIHFNQMSQNLFRREAELDQLRRIDRMINSSLDLELVLKHILNGALELTNADFSQVVLTGKYAVDLVQQINFPDTEEAKCLVQPGLMDLLDQLTGPALSQVKELLVKNNRMADIKPGSNGNDKCLGSWSLLGTTIALNDTLIGVLSIASRQEQAFNVQSLELLEQIAVQAAIAIRNAYQFKTERDIRERLANVSQVVAMGDMASNMVHSINNWVGAVRADVKYLMRQQALEQLDPTELDEMLADMLTNSEATLAMAENIKKPFQPSEQESIDVNECILHVLQEKRADMLNAIIIEDLQPVPAVIATHQLELVFQNLLNNALQAMEGQVRGIVKFTSRLSKDGQWVMVTIQDSGRGLPKNMNPRDMFKLGVSGRDDGMGYGLWWCDTFLKRWGGRIQYVNNAKRGCKFLVKLPTSGLSPLEQYGENDE